MREGYSPGQVIIHLDRSRKLDGLAEMNGTVKALLEGKEDEESCLRVCEGGVCGLPVASLEEARRVLGQWSWTHYHEQCGA